MITLYPQDNAVRMTCDLGGIWDFRFRGDDRWQPIAVPASYNDQKPDYRFRNEAGIVEYRRKITVPSAWAGRRVCLRFDGVAHSARVWGRRSQSIGAGSCPLRWSWTGS